MNSIIRWLSFHNCSMQDSGYLQVSECRAAVQKGIMGCHKLVLAAHIKARPSGKLSAQLHVIQHPLDSKC